MLQTLDQMGVDLGRFTMTPIWGEPPRYRLFVDERDVVSPQFCMELAQSVDASLQTINCEYQDKRSSQRLAPVDCEVLPEASWRQFVHRRIGRMGGSIEQYKHPCLVPDPTFESRFLSDVHGDVKSRSDQSASKFSPAEFAN